MITKLNQTFSFKQLFTEDCGCFEKMKEGGRAKMKNGSVVPVNKLQVGMKGEDYAGHEGKIVSIAKVKDFDKIKRYDSSGAMQDAISDSDDYEIEPDDILVAVEMKEDRGPFVFVYGGDGFTVTENKSAIDRMKENGKFKPKKIDNTFKPGQLFKVKQSVAKGYAWDTTNYRMLVIDTKGTYLAYDNRTNKIIEGMGTVSRKSEELVEGIAAPKELIADFKERKDKFWTDLFSTAQKNTSTKILKSNN